MAQKVVVSITDDLDGTSEGAETLSFSLDGVSYEIDLIEKNSAKLRKAMAPFIEAARKPSKTSAKAGLRKARLTSREVNVVPATVNTDEIRTWARSQGIAVKDRGRIPGDVVAAYKSAHKLVAVAS